MSRHEQALRENAPPSIAIDLEIVPDGIAYAARYSLLPSKRSGNARLRAERPSGRIDANSNPHDPSAPQMDVPNLTEEQRRRIICISDSYERLTGRPLISAEGDPVGALWSAPFAIVSHGTEPDPIFFFGNRAALALFEMDFADFTRLPSRFSAEPLLREERADLLDRVTRDGIIEDYAGVRISATGKRFHISNASVWNLADAAGTPAGQAAAFADWAYITPSS